MRPSLIKFSAPGILLVLVLLISCYPLVTLLVQGVGSSGHIAIWNHVFHDPAAQIAVLHTLISSSAASLAAVTGGVGFGYLLVRSTLPGKRVFEGLMLGLLVLPPFVTSLAFLGAYGPGGLVPMAWQHIFATSPNWNQIYSGTTVIWLLGLHGLPLAYLLIRPALSGQNRELEEAARVSGLTGWKTLWQITLPALLPTLKTAGVLVFVTAASEYGIPAVIGLPGNYQTLTTMVLEKLTYGLGSQSFQESIVLALLLGIVGVLAFRIPATARYTWKGENGSTAQRPTTDYHLGMWSIPTALLLSLFFAVAFLLPLVSLLAVASTRAYGLPPLPANLTLQHFLSLLHDPTVRQAVFTSVRWAGTAAIVIGPIGLGLSAWAQRSRLGSFVASMGALPNALPGSTLAIAMILAWDHHFPLIGSLYGSGALLGLAYIGRFMAFGLFSGDLAWRAVGRDRQEAALASGLSPLQQSRRIIWPLGGPSLLAGMLWVFITVLHELTVSTLLYAPGTETVGVVVMQLQQAGNPTETAALAVLLSLATASLAALAPYLLADRHQEVIRPARHRSGASRLSHRKPLDPSINLP